MRLRCFSLIAAPGFLMLALTQAATDKSDQWSGLSSTPSSRAREAALDFVATNLAQVLQLRPLPANGDFSPADWTKYVTLAQVLQSRTPEDMRALLTAAVALSRSRPMGVERFEIDSRVAILLRVMFDTPPGQISALGLTARPAGGVVLSSASVTDSSAPVAWSKSGPVLTSHLAATFGTSHSPLGGYDALIDFEVFRASCKPRDLSQFQPAVISTVGAP